MVLTATDNLSGVAATYYQIDGGQVLTGTSPVVSGSGTHTLTYWSADNAGNLEASRSVTVKIDKIGRAHV